MSLIASVPLKTKLITGFALSSVITVCVGIFAVFELNKVNGADTELYERATAPMADLLRVSVDFQRIRVNLQGVATADDDADLQKHWGQIVDLRAEVDKHSKALEPVLITAEEQRIFDEYKIRRTEFRAMTDKVVEMKKSGNSDGADKYLEGEGRGIATKYQDVIDRLVALKINQGRELSNSNDALAAFSGNMIYAVLVAGFLFSIGQGLLLTRAVLAQLGEDPGYLAEVSGKIAGGDLHVVFRPQKKPGGVYHVLQNMVATMKEKIAEAEQKSLEAEAQARQAEIATQEANEAKAAAERAKAEGMLQAAQRLESVVGVVSAASEQLSALIEQSSRGAEEQSQRVSETATAMEEMNATVGEVAKNAVHASSVTDTTRTKAQEGERMVGNVVRDISAVQKQSVELKADMASLGKQADGIGQIMSVISDIADQTNLLALNAAIEAARAGDAGRGFAVVADEVRKLAEKTMTATQEVGAVISGIQEGTRKSIDGVDRSVDTIESATRRATESGAALAEIVTLVDQSNDQVRSIATASEQQSAASDEINRAVEQVATISAQTAQAMSRATQAMNEMAHQAQVLRGLIDELKAG